MPTERVRCFISLEIDELRIRQSIADVQMELKNTRANLKLVDPAVMHLTLWFLGEIHNAQVETVKNAMGSLQFRPFQIEFTGMGAFPSLNRIKVVWVRVSKGDEQIKDIYRQLNPKLAELGFKQEDRDLTPHLTIARVKSAMNKVLLADLITKMHDAHFGSMTVNSIKLKKSVLTPQGPIYTTLHEVTALQ